VLLALGFTATGRERGAVSDLVRAEATGDPRAVLKQLPACGRQPACAAATARRVPGMRRAGAVQILQYLPSAQFTLTNSVGTGRVAWRAGASLPVVQCVRVQRNGPLTGAGVELLAISPPIDRQGSCP
jgi:hypothetical protein